MMDDYDDKGPEYSRTYSQTITSPRNAKNNDEMEENEADEWICLISPQDVNYRLWFNQRKQITTFQRPACVPEEDARQAVEEGLGELEFAYPPDREMSGADKLRFHLDKIQRHVDTCTQIAAHSVSGGGGSNAPIIGGKNKKDKRPQPEQHEEATTLDYLKQIGQTIALARGTIKHEEAKEHHKGSALDYLIGWDGFTWDFAHPENQAMVDWYRSTSQQTDHTALQYKDWHMPQYLSAQALLPDIQRIRLQVSLSAAEHAATPNLVKRTAVEVSMEDTVSAVVSKAYLKIYKSTPTNDLVSSFILKAQGFNEFFLHDTPIGQYYFIRKAVRDLQEPQLVLCRLPDEKLDGYITPEKEEQAQWLVENYQAKVNTNIVALHKAFEQELQDLTPQSFQDMSTLGICGQSCLNIPFHVDVIGAENINADTCPRLGQISSSALVGIYVKAVLFHGCVDLPWMYETQPSADSENVFYNETFPGNALTFISNLPRETRIGFVLMAKVKRKNEDDVDGEKAQAAQQQVAAAGATNEEKDDDKDIPLAWVVNNLIDYNGILVSGMKEHLLWPLPSEAKHKKAASQRKRDVDPYWLCRSSNNDNHTTAQIQPVKLYIQYPTFRYQVLSPLVTPYIEPNARLVGHELQRALDKIQSSTLLRVIGTDPLFELTPDLKQLLWNCRHYLIDLPHILPKVLNCVDWTKPDMKHEAYRLLSIWTPFPNPIDAMELLDCRYPDYQVREYAVQTLKQVDDDQLQLFLLQLVQCVKYENYHDSPLSRFLLERAMQNPYQIAHSLYWHLKAEIHDPQYCERFTCLMEELLSHSGLFTEELSKQLHLVQKLQKIADDIIRWKRQFNYSDEDAMAGYRKALVAVNDYIIANGKIQIPLNPKWEAKGLLIEKCKYMSSKMVPLWLVFENADPDGPPIYLIFKSGDDLRQDLLTLQILRVMDNIWLSHGMDLRLKPYGVVATGVNDNGEGVGMIEVVLNSTTTSDIQITFGGGARGALKVEPIDDFLRANNSVTDLAPSGVLVSDGNNQAQSSFDNSVFAKDAKQAGKKDDKEPFTCYRAAVENFVRSAAGYCVATYVLGVADRHNGNIMVTKNGHLFHIDFGHFLGNFKKKFGMNRERAAFVFTLEMAYVMGGKDWKNHYLFRHFQTLVASSFRHLRKNTTLLSVLFMLMLGSGLPELQCESDINYLREKLMPGVEESAAEKAIGDELKRALDNTSRRLDNMIHNMVHK